MSSYLINKDDYVRVAGVIAGIGTSKNWYKENYIYRYNHEEKRVYEALDFYHDIMKLYELNYLDMGYKTMPDENAYQIEYSKAFKYGKEIVEFKRSELTNLIRNIHKFFQSVNYQIDNRELNKQANEIMNSYLVALYNIKNNFETNYDSNIEYWGEFKIA